MDLKELLRTIDATAKETKSSKPYLVGGMVRDIVLKRFNEVTDIDITCGDATSDRLGQAMVRKIQGAVYTKFSDGHGSLSFERFKVDFSNNFNTPAALPELKKIGITRPSSMELELYSRDFTINSMLMPLDLTKIYDLTGRGMKDIRAKVIDTCLTPQITFTADPRRIARIVYLGAKLGFYPSKRVIDWVVANPNAVTGIDKKYCSDKINKAIDKNAKLAFEIIDSLNMKQLVPNSKAYTDFLVEEPELLYRALNE